MIDESPFALIGSPQQLIEDLLAAASDGASAT